MDRLDTPRLAAVWLAAAAAAAGVAASITAVYLAMRDLMAESGGTCAAGGPYVIANECSSGQVALLFGGVVSLLLFTGVQAAVTHWADGPRIGWPAILGFLFIALGWNFVDFGLNPPGGDGSDAGWLVSGVVFWLMAIGFMAPVATRAAEWIRRGGEPEAPLFRGATVRAEGVPLHAVDVTEAEGTPAIPAPPAPADVPTRLVIPPRPPGDPGSRP